MLMKTVLPLLLAVTAALLPSAAWGEDDEALLDPSVYRSPSGRYVVEVNPDEPWGRGGATYSLRCDGRLRWKKTLPYSMREVVVGDDGVFGGAAMLANREVWRRGRPTGWVVCAVIGPTGIVFAEHRTEQHDSGPHGRREPSLTGVWGTPDNRMLVDLRYYGGKATTTNHIWQQYDLRLGALASGREVAAPEFECDGRRYWIFQAASRVSAVPLMLVQWSAFCGTNHRTIFGLHDLTGTCVWSMSTSDTASKQGDATFIEARSQEIVLSSPEEGWTKTFAIRANAPTVGGWLVEEVESVAFERPKQEVKSAPELAEITLRYIGKIELEPAWAEWTPYEGIKSFAIARDGSKATLRIQETRPFRGYEWSLRIVDPKGETETEVPLQAGAKQAVAQPPLLPGVKRGFAPRHIFATPDGWLLLDDARFSPAVGASMQRIDPAGAVIEVVEPAMTRMDAATTLSDGRLACIPALMAEKPKVALLKRDGSVEWSHDLECSPSNIAATSSDCVAIVDMCGEEVSVWDSAGRQRPSINIERSLGWKPNLVKNIYGGAGDTLIIEALGRGPDFTVLSLDGARLAEFDLGPFGSSLTEGPMIRADLDGALWMTDGQSLQQIDTAGRVLRQVEPPAKHGCVDDLYSVAASPNGCIYGLRWASHDIFVFDSDGHYLRWLGSAVTNSESYRTRGAALTVAGDGSACFAHDGGDRTYFQRFSLDGRRSFVPVASLPMTTFYSAVFAARSGDERVWALGNSELSLLNSDGSIAASTKRRSDNKWLRGGSLAVAPDGSLALTQPGGWATFDASGRARSFVAAPSSKICTDTCFDGKNIVGVLGGDVLISDERGDCQAVRFEGFETKNVTDVMFSPWNEEVWVRGADSPMTIRRFAMPAK